MKLLEYTVIAWHWIILLQNTEASADTEEPVAQFVLEHGYPLEIYNDIQTSDGYLLKVYRIPHGKQNTQVPFRTPILLVHGLFGYSGDFLVMGPERGLGFLLAEKYDVWLLNARGTTPSRKHVELNPNNNTKFWQFSWNEIGLYDIPATMNLIQNITKQEKLIYIGFSQGTTAFYVMASETPNINEKVSMMVSLAPVAFTQNFNNTVVKFLAKMEPFWTRLARLTGIQELLPQSMMKRVLPIIAALCNMNAVREFCANVVFMVGGINSTQLDKAVLSNLVSTISGISTRQILHFAQNINSGEFRKYDYGLQENIKCYGSKNPPMYNISKITSNIVLYYSENDGLTNYKDVESLCEQLPNCLYKHKISYKYFNHLDFMVAVDLVKLVYDDLFKVLNEHDNNNTR